MALRRFARVALNTGKAPAIGRAIGVRMMAVDMKDRERAAEKVYFNKEEEKLLRKLMKKMKDQVDEANPKEAKQAKETERTKLLTIVSKYNMSYEDIEKLLEWRHDPSI